MTNNKLAKLIFNEIKNNPNYIITDSYTIRTGLFSKDYFLEYETKSKDISGCIEILPSLGQIMITAENLRIKKSGYARIKISLEEYSKYANRELLMPLDWMAVITTGYLRTNPDGLLWLTDIKLTDIVSEDALRYDDEEDTEKNDSVEEE